MASSRSPSPSLPRSRSVSPTTATTRLIQQNRNQFAGLSDSSSGEEEDNGILRPRGRMAARMQVRGNEEESSAAASSQSENESGSPKKTTTTESGRIEGSNEGGSLVEEEDGEDEDVITTRRPRTLTKARRERTSTPEITVPQDTPASAPASPGLFVSPSKPQSPSPEMGENSDGEEASTKKLNARFQALVAKKREERLAREAEEARKKAARRQRAGFEDHDDGILADDDDDEDNDNITDDEGGRRLTQEAGATSRPARKASKKALEEMNRETQRLTRSLQLAHEAKVRKKISKATLFERFNFKPGGGSVATTKASEEVAAVSVPVPAADTGSSRPPTPGSVLQSDAEMKDAETPPSSPPTAEKEKAEGVLSTVVETAAEAEEDEEEEFPDLDTLVQQAAVKKIDKGKGKATAADLKEQAGVPQKRNIRVKLPLQLQANRAAVSVSLEDDDDLEVVPTRKSKLDAIFDRVPANQAKQANTLHILRRLAHLDDPDKRAAPPTRAGNKLKKEHQEVAMTTGELRANLLQRARQQAKLERDRHLEMLRAKGVHVQTAEEREREEQDVEDMVAKARREVEEIMDREREAAKAERKQRRDAGEEDPLGWDDESDDEDYEEEGVDEGEEKEIELSGSEEEEEGDEEDEEDEEGDEEDEDKEEGEGLIDDVAPVADESETGEDDEDLPSTRPAKRRPRKQTTILSDDEDEDDVQLPTIVKATPRPKSQFPKSPSVRTAKSPSVPTSVLRSATKTFIPGLPVAGPAGLGLTQIFAGTMDDSQMGMTQASPSQPRPTFNDTTAFPDSNFSQTARETGDDLILDSQQQQPGRETQQQQQQQAEETQGVQIRFSQSQVHGFDTFLDEMAVPPTQMSDLLEPTQDGGFCNLSPLRHRFVERPVSTIATVPVGRTQTQADPADEAEEQNESPLVRRTGKLRRKADMVAPVSPSRGSPVERGSADDDVEIGEFGDAIPNSNGPSNGVSAFQAMKKAALKEKKRKEAFDKKKSKAREMIEEQAEESEDEYAGLGGADGEDSDDADDALVKEMIDDETGGNEGDERKLAAFYADRERADDEKRVEKLFHDVTTGQLRRKRGGGDWDDLDDSDDDGEARRRMKRRQFAKMQRTLYADERISKVAENPRNQAFMRTIEDRGSDDEMDFIFAPPAVAGPGSGGESQSQSQSQAGPDAIIPNSQPQTTTAAIPAPNPRRTKTGKKPSNIGEIRETLSNLLDEPFGGSVIPATELGSDDEADADVETQESTTSGSSNNKENHNPRRTSNQIIDRISMKRNASNASSTSNKLAFAAAANPTTTTTTTGSSTSTSTSTSTFKVPALLRRATTNSLLSTSSSTSSTTSSSTTKNTNNPTSRQSSENIMKIKKPAGKRSGVSYLARETERRAALAEAERRREAKKMRGAEGRGKVVGGLFGGGRFE